MSVPLRKSEWLKDEMLKKQMPGHLTLNSSKGVFIHLFIYFWQNINIPCTFWFLCIFNPKLVPPACHFKWISAVSNISQSHQWETLNPLNHLKHGPFFQDNKCTNRIPLIYIFIQIHILSGSWLFSILSLEANLIPATSEPLWGAWESRNSRIPKGFPFLPGNISTFVFFYLSFLFCVL